MLASFNVFKLRLNFFYSIDSMLFHIRKQRIKAHLRIMETGDCFGKPETVEIRELHLEMSEYKSRVADRQTARI